MKRTAIFVVALGLAATGARGGGSELPDPVGDADFVEVDPEQAELGRLLFWDPILSGNRNISCGTCHHPRFGTSDGLSLGMGEGGSGVGPDRIGEPANPPEERIPRNAPGLWNLGAHEFTVLFHDGRIEADPARPSGLRTPMGVEMEQGFSGVLSAQTMFPVLSDDEMAGHYSENEVSKAARMGRITGEGGAWAILSERVAAIPEYTDRFARVDPEIAAGRAIHFTDISDAIAAFMAHEWRADDSPFDRHLRKEAPLTGAAADGMALFYGEAACITCHSGPFQTDHGFHAMGVPQFGPGKRAAFEDHAQDIGRMRVTGRAEDAYRFRTPSLRNVTMTAPYGHSGAYADLRSFLSDHGRGEAAAFDRSRAVLPRMEVEDWRALDDPAERAAIAAAAETFPPLDGTQMDAILAFLAALTDEGAAAGRLGIPDAVPSGLKVDK
ncbi:cytochrome-c peroxidase [Citreimonas salinaria]|uniref:Cytochrome c peroxidase n=1 Tax=Citreimonas salinaria TaxID=321339 RepID=A0A1H3LWS1_9RHOB|nr:cytochrome c peroxidase [Citreimonas salinaria]SDY68464.1 cytochrome c peroxidase [Citreimonas salinaria]